MKTKVTQELIHRAIIQRAIEALEESAHIQAGTSTEPYLINKEETQQWEDAKCLRNALRYGGWKP